MSENQARTDVVAEEAEDEVQAPTSSKRTIAKEWVTDKASRANGAVRRVSWTPVGLAVGAAAALAVGVVVLKNRRG